MPRTAATTSYLAGIGASGALLATTVVAFLFISALVAFNAFPSLPGIGGGVEAGSSIDVAERRAGSSQLAARSLPSETAASSSREIDLLLGSDGVGGGTGEEIVGGEGQPIAPGPGSGPGAPTSPSEPTSSPGSPSGGLDELVDNTVNGVNETVTNLNTAVNNTVNGLNTTISNTLNGLNLGN
jgi:hypothetical protein